MIWLWLHPDLIANFVLKDQMYGYTSKEDLCDVYVVFSLLGWNFVGLKGKFKEALSEKGFTKKRSKYCFHCESGG